MDKILIPWDLKGYLFKLKTKRTKKTIKTNFLIIDITIAYNVILKRLTVNAIKTVAAPYLLLIQFELDDGRVRKLYRTKHMARELY